MDSSCDWAPSAMFYGLLANFFRASSASTPTSSNWARSPKAMRRPIWSKDRRTAKAVWEDVFFIATQSKRNWDEDLVCPLSWLLSSPSGYFRYVLDRVNHSFLKRECFASTEQWEVVLQRLIFGIELGLLHDVRLGLYRTCGCSNQPLCMQVPHTRP